MKFTKLNLCTLIATLLLFTGLHLHAQQEINVETDGKTITIIKKYKDSDGYEVTEKIVKDASEAEDLDQILQNVDGENIDIHILKTDDEAFDFDFDEEDFDLKIDNFMKGMDSSFGSCCSDCKKGKMNIYLDTDADVAEGILVDRVIEDGAAAKAGMQTGDIILAIDGQKTDSYHQLKAAMRDKKPNDVVKIDYERGGNYYQSQVTLGEEIRSKKQKYDYSYNYDYPSYKRNPCKPFIGVYLTSRGDNGVRITKVIDGTAADNADLEAGDRITAIDGTDVRTQREIIRLRDLHKAGDYFTISYLRDGEEYEVEAQFTPCDTEEQDVAETKPETLPTPNLPDMDINNSLELEMISAFPNPTKDRFTLKFAGPAVPTVVRLTDASGRVLMTERLNEFDGQYEDEINLSKYAPGLYLINVIQGDKVFTEKVILTKNRA